MPRFSLTTRLTALFCLSSAGVLLGLGILIATAMDRHFAEEDFASLGDNVRLIERIAAENASASVPERLAVALEHHPGFVAHVSAADGKTLYTSHGFDFQTALGTASVLPAGRDSFVWEQDGKTYRGLRSTVQAASGLPAPLTIVVGMDTEIHAHFMRASSLCAVTARARVAMVRNGASPRRAAHQPSRPLARAASAT